MVEPVKTPEFFNPNVDDADAGPLKGERALFPIMRGMFGEGSAYNFEQYISVMEETVKAIQIPPSMMTFARMSYMPDQTNSGLLQWPGIPPESLAKILRENVLPQFIINQRVLDVMRYSQLSNHPWKPGWRMELVAGGNHPDEADKKDMREAEQFLINCNIELSYAHARERDAKGLTDLQRFLCAATRDTLTFDGLALWTQMDNKDRVQGYSLLPSGYIRMAPKGYEGNKETFAVAVDQGGSVVHTFTRRQLIWYTRNPRVDPEYGGVGSGYGYPEIEMGVRLIQGFQNAIDLNVDTFNRSSVPNGILVLKGGGWTQRQLDVLARLWGNLKKGVSKAWALPAVATPKDGDLSVLDLQELKDKDVRYQDHMNMMAGGFCTVFGFPPRRLGYRISGKGPDAQPLQDQKTEIVDEDDPGLPVLLLHFENVINQYLLRPRWPGIKMVFTGKNPKEDAREYEAKKNAQTWKEARAEADLPDLKTVVASAAKKSKDADKVVETIEKAASTSEEMAFVAELMELCPIDPNLSGVYQSLAAAIIAAKFGGDEAKTPTPGNRMNSKRDPAKSEAHGATSGVRRNSSSEKKPTKKAKPKTLYVSRRLKNADEFIKWAKAQGFSKTIVPEDMHVTIAFSRDPVDWGTMGDSFDEIRIPATSKERVVEALGDKGAVVLKFSSTELHNRWQEFIDGGCSWDHPGYHPHVTITFDGSDVDLDDIDAYDGELVFGVERFEPVVEEWEQNVKEAAE